MIGYDFGKFTLTGIVTHSLYRNAIVPAVSSGEETRSWVGIVVPLYVAPTAAPVVARYWALSFYAEEIPPHAGFLF